MGIDRIGEARVHVETVSVRLQGMHLYPPHAKLFPFCAHNKYSQSLLFCFSNQFNVAFICHSSSMPCHERYCSIILSSPHPSPSLNIFVHHAPSHVDMVHGDKMSLGTDDKGVDSKLPIWDTFTRESWKDQTYYTLQRYDSL